MKIEEAIRIKEELYTQKRALINEVSRVNTSLAQLMNEEKKRLRKIEIAYENGQIFKVNEFQSEIDELLKQKQHLQQEKEKLQQEMASNHTGLKEVLQTYLDHRAYTMQRYRIEQEEALKVHATLLEIVEGMRKKFHSMQSFTGHINEMADDLGEIDTKVYSPEASELFGVIRPLKRK